MKRMRDIECEDCPYWVCGNCVNRTDRCVNDMDMDDDNWYNNQLSMEEEAYNWYHEREEEDL